MWQQVSAWLSTHVIDTILWGVAAVITIGSTIWAVYATRKVRKPRYGIVNLRIIDNADKSIPNLQLHYKGIGDNIDRLTMSYIAFWNEGGEAIRRSDIAQADPLRFSGTDGRILGVESVKDTNPAGRCVWTLDKDGNTIGLTFDFLSKGDATLVRVYHTGSHPLWLQGHIIDGGPPLKKGMIRLGRRKGQPGTIRREPKRDRFLGAMIVVMGFVIWLGTGANVLYAYDLIPKPFVQQPIEATVLFAFGTVWSATIMYLGYHISKRILPKGLAEYENMFW
jgi:hypothetical protein